MSYVHAGPRSLIFRKIGLIALVVLFLVPQVVLASPGRAVQQDCFEINFDTDSNGNPLPAGTIITDQWADIGVTLSTNSPTNHPLMIFDTGNPTGGDWDLGTPNEDFGGPGIGAGGGAGMPGENSVALGNALIIAQENDPSDPNDYVRGGTITISFDPAATILATEILDIEEETQGVVELYDSSNNLVASHEMHVYGNNSYQQLALNETGITTMKVIFPGSGAMTLLTYCPQDPTAVQFADWRTAGNDNQATFSWLAGLLLLSLVTAVAWQRRRPENGQG